MKTAIVFNSNRDGYGIEQIRKPMTVGELRSILEDYDDDALFIISHDNDYTFGTVGYPRYFEQAEDSNDFIEM